MTPVTLRRMPFLLACLLAAWSCALPSLRAAPTLERWSGRGVRAAHQGKLEVGDIGGLVRLRFDLSDLRAGTEIRGAWLSLEKAGGQPREPILVHEIGAVEGGQVRRRGGALVLEPPWYCRFTAADAVRRWTSDHASNLGFAVQPFEGFRPEKSCLDIAYEGEGSDLPPQVEGLRAFHRDGQTFLIWKEHPAYRPRPEEIFYVEKFSEKGDVLAAGPGPGAAGMSRHPAITLRALRRLQGLGLRDKPSGFQGIRGLERSAEVEPVSYRVYRHTERIESANIHRTEMIAEVDPLSGLDTEVYKIHFQGEYLDQREDPDSVIPTFRLPDREPMRPGEALYVHTAREPGRAYYAVTEVLAGTENLARLAGENSLVEPVAEAPAPPRPVLQWIQEDAYNADPPELWYRFWVAPPFTNLPSRSFRAVLAVSDGFKGPGPLTIGTISGAFNVREEIHLPRSDRVTLLIEKQLPWLPDLFMNEGHGTLRGASECRVDSFCERYTAFLIEWVKGKYAIDPARTEGDLLEFGLRHPEIFPRMSFGAYTATYDYLWAPGDPDHLGPRGIRTLDGDDAWEGYSLVGYVLKHPEREIPLLICISGTGKDSGHTSEFGWQDDPRGWAALQKARQPFVASWSGGGDPYRLSRLLAEVPWHETVPAFSRSSLDNNPGNGDPADGDYYGQINGYLLWDGGAAVDEPDRWEMDLWIVEACPRDQCTADVTPRHSRRFKPGPGDRFEWTIADASGNVIGSAKAMGSDKVIASGRVEADRFGLVTIEKVALAKARRRLSIRRI
jgi:hypothetical protein